MNVAEYAKKYNVSKQSVYDKLKRGTLNYRVVNGIKEIIIKPIKENIKNNIEIDKNKALKKALKRLNKKSLKVKKLKIKNKYMKEIINSKNKEITTLEKSLSAFSLILEKKLNPPKIIHNTKIKKDKKDKKK